MALTGRPKGTSKFKDLVSIHVYVDREMRDRLNAFCEGRGMTLSGFLRVLAQNYVAKEQNVGR